MAPATSQIVLGALVGDSAASIADLAAETGVGRHEVQRCCDMLRRRGWAERVETGHYRLTEAGATARRNGTAIKPGPQGPHTGIRKPVRDTFRSRLWAALRALRKATVPELITIAGEGSERASASNAQRYLRFLERAGYVTRLRARDPGTAITSNGFVKWALIRDTGRQAPIWRTRGEVFDPNTGERIPLASRGDAA